MTGLLLAAQHDGHHRTLLMDPPWICAAGGGGRGAQEHYPLMTTKDINALLQASIPEFKTLRPAFLWMWHTSGSSTDAHWLMKQLGFTVITDWVWVKQHVGTGQYRRGRHETLLLGKRGEIQRVGQWPDSVFSEAETVHSRKPDESYRCIEAVTPGPRLEIFARRPRDGWDVWGNEICSPPVPACTCCGGPATSSVTMTATGKDPWDEPRCQTHSTAQVYLDGKPWEVAT